MTVTDNSRAGVAESLLALFRLRGNDRYDEVVTQTEHALQCGAHAMAAQADLSLVVASFLHDIGHLLGPTATGSPSGDHRHQTVGADHLARWFGPAVTEPVRLHVPAKRYLCATDAAYHGGLSPASVDSLRLQGGAMTSGECLEFERLAFAAPALRLRAWDDLAKTPNAPTPPLELFGDLIVELLGD